MKNKQPPFQITNKMIADVAEISELTGRLSAHDHLSSSPNLRRTNRIRTIHGSLAIEQNTLSLEQVTAVLNGKHVLAPPKDIAEVKNAYEIYERLDELVPSSNIRWNGMLSCAVRGTVDLGGFLPSLFFFRNGIMGVISLHKQCIVIAGLVRTHLRANKTRLKVVPQNLFSGLAVFLVHGQKEHRQHHRHHAEGSTGIACGVPQNKEQRHAHDCRCPKTDKLPGGQVEG